MNPIRPLTALPSDRGWELDNRLLLSLLVAVPKRGTTTTNSTQTIYLNNIVVAMENCPVDLQGGLGYAITRSNQMLHESNTLVMLFTLAITANAQATHDIGTKSLLAETRLARPV